jgi:hypothetical protein
MTAARVGTSPSNSPKAPASSTPHKEGSNGARSAQASLDIWMPPVAATVLSSQPLAANFARRDVAPATALDERELQ